MKASDNEFPKLHLVEQVSTPPTPVTGTQTLFIRSSDHALCLIDENGTVSVIAAGAGGGYTQNCSLYKSASPAQSVPHNTIARVTWDQERYDTDDMHSNTVNNSRITIQTPGKYHFSSVVRYAVNNTGYRSGYMQVTRGAQVYYPGGFGCLANVFDYTDVVLFGDFDCLEGDYVEVFVNQFSGGNLNIVGGDLDVTATVFQAFRMG